MENVKIKKEKEKQGYSTIRNVFYLLKDIYGENKILFLFIITEAVCGIITPLFGIYLPKFAVELVTQKADTRQILFTLGLFTAIMMVAVVLQNVSSNAKYMHYNNLRWFYLRKLLFKSLDCDYSNIESSGGLIRYQKARNALDQGDQSATSYMVLSIIAIFSSSISFILYSGIISALNPLIVVMLIGLTVINFFSDRYALKYEEKHRDESSQIGRKLGYVEHCAKDMQAGKDVRIYNMINWLIPMRNNFLEAFIKLQYKIKNRYYMSGVVHGLTLLIRDGAAYAYLVYMVSNGNVEIGDFVLYFGAIAGFSGFINNIASHFNQIRSANVQMNDMRDFLENSNLSEPVNPVEIPARNSAMSVSFRNVCFSYNQESVKVLDNFNLEINAGEKIALVGVNGAGKTTIVKLLCGFYTPDSGEILINGIDIRNFRKADLYKLFSAVFQDIVILPFTVAENISMRLGSKTDKNLAWACIEKAGLEEFMQTQEKGIDSKMLKNIDPDGLILSGGQQQKLLLARALYKNAPVLILDEPTAALDPIAESEVYEKFHEMSQNKTALYISHRLASTRFCDRIVFLKDGVAAEIGSHWELMQNGGEYANMFEIQSHYYQENIREENGDE